MNADGSNRIQVLHIDGSSAEGDATAVAWSPDGKSIVFTTLSGSIQTVGLVTGDRTVITSETMAHKTYYAPVYWPCCSPDGTKILFTASFHETPPPSNAYIQLFVVNVDGGNLTKLNPNGVDDDGASWSPDGSRIVFASLRDGSSDIYIMDADGTNAVRLTNDANSKRRPVWSPDGSRIAFTAYPWAGGWAAMNTQTEIYVMEADGTNLTRLTDNSIYEGSISWSPDGSTLILNGSAVENAGVSVNSDMYFLDVP
jgi:Tol biopolymer transport system component